jgi:hypothetical protein
MNRDRYMAATLRLSLAEQQIAGSLELARRSGDAVVCRPLEQAGNHLRSLRAILAAARPETLEVQPAPGEWQGGAPDFWAQPHLPFGAVEPERGR